MDRQRTRKLTIPQSGKNIEINGKKTLLELLKEEGINISAALGKRQMWKMRRPDSAGEFGDNISP